eukprot:RCo013353
MGEVALFELARDALLLGVGGAAAISALPLFFHRYGLAVMLSLPTAWIFLTVLCLASAKLPTLLTSGLDALTPFLNVDTIDQARAALATVEVLTGSFSRQHLTPNAVLLVATALMLMWGLSTAAWRLHRLNRAQLHQ